MYTEDLFGHQDTREHVRQLERRRRSRCSDPDTSIDSGIEVRKRIGSLAAVLSAADATPRTARELAERANSGGEIESLRKRARELFDQGLLAAKTPRRCRHTNKKAATYVRV
mgnify:CR=1 FL=1